MNMVLRTLVVVLLWVGGAQLGVRLTGEPLMGILFAAIAFFWGVVWLLTTASKGIKKS